MKKKKLKIAVAMSGGVDSSVAAKLLKNQGHEVAGIFLHFWKDDSAAGDFENKCCSAEALLDAKRVADKIGIPLYSLNFTQRFKKQIVDNFLAEYAAGRTPNPCVRCNKFVKLGYLIKQAEKLGFDRVASGHYAKIKKSGRIYKLFKASDKAKDQSYFLYGLGQTDLRRLLFPLGGLTKNRVRQLAAKFKLPVAQKRDSQEICFIPGRDHNDFLKRHLKLKPGIIKTQSGRAVGRHAGLPLYTVGQRKGVAGGGSGPYYAAKMDYKKNILLVVNDVNDPALFSNDFKIKNANWPSGKPPLNCQVVIRYRHVPVACRLSRNRNFYGVRLKSPQRAVTAGQSAVFYRGSQVLGGGIIA